jgi:hypothetical protein
VLCDQPLVIFTFRHNFLTDFYLPFTFSDRFDCLSLSVLVFPGGFALFQKIRNRTAPCATTSRSYCRRREKSFTYRVFHFAVSISAPRLDLRSKSQQILILARGRSIWNFQPLGPKARAMPVDFSDALEVKPIRSGTSENDAASDCCLSLAERDVGA